MATVTSPAPRRRFTRLAVATALAATTLVAAGVGISGSTAQAACRAWAFVGVPGSNQGLAHKPNTSDTNRYGAEVARVKSYFVSRKGSANVSAYAIKYPAKLDASYGSSVNSGVTTTYNTIRAIRVSCPSQKIVISGFSQGAHVVALTLGKLSTADAAYVKRAALMGNPIYKDGATPSVEAPSGSVTRNGLLNFFGNMNWQSRWNSKARDVCINNDIVCEGSSSVASLALKYLVGAHGTYRSTKYPGQSVDIARYLGYNWLGGAG